MNLEQIIDSHYDKIVEETIKNGAEEMSDEYIYKLAILQDLKSRKQELVEGIVSIAQEFKGEEVAMLIERFKKDLKMKLGNRFNQGRKQRMWMDDPYCAICTSNQNCSVHHIYGCKGKYTNSLINSILLCETHHKFADTHNIHECGNEHRREYLAISLPRFVRLGFSFLKEDKGFIKSIQEDIDFVLEKIR